jgi:putative ABC transport system substrate-binding protein
LPGEALRTGLVTGLARPGGNVTGVAVQSGEVASKRVGLLREIVPGLRHLAHDRFRTRRCADDWRRRDGGWRALHRSQRPRNPANRRYRPAFDTVKSRAEALYVSASPFIIVNVTHPEQIATLVLGQRLPTISSSRFWPEAGGLMSYGANVSDVYRRSAEMIDQILRGTKPADIPVQRPITFELIINSLSGRNQQSHRL